MRFTPAAGSPVLLSLLLAGCTPEHRDVQLGGPEPSTDRSMRLGASSADRFGLRQQSQRPEATKPSFAYELPEGWEEKPVSGFRPVNLAGPGITAWVTQLGPGAGGLLANVNRWRRQVDLPPVESDALEDVPERELLGESALYFDLTSDDRSKRLVGLMQFGADRSVFVRITGKASDVEEQLPAFDAFVASLKDAPAGAGSTGGGSGRGGSGSGNSGSGSSDSGNSGSGTGGLVWTAPQDWQALGDDSLRTAHYQVAPGVRIWSTVLGGNGGGVAMNIGRWCRQYGKTVPSASEIAALPTLTMLGQSALFVDLTHDDDVTRGMYGVICLLGDRAVFVKMEGPSAAVRAQEAAFKKFCEDLRAG